VNFFGDIAHVLRNTQKNFLHFNKLDDIDSTYCALRLEFMNL